MSLDEDEASSSLAQTRWLVHNDYLIWQFFFFFGGNFLNSKETESSGRLGGSVVEHLPSAQIVIAGSWDRV